MKFYLDEDLSPKIAEILRRNNVDAISAHEKEMTGASDREQLEQAAREKRCLVTRNRNDFIRLTLQFFNDQLPHHGVLIVPYTLPGDQFARIARLLKAYYDRNKAGLESYQVDFLTKQLIPDFAPPRSYEKE
jgi:predicted nuclease of predicted toxin-antitoxin system